MRKLLYNSMILLLISLLNSCGGGGGTGSGTPSGPLTPVNVSVSSVSLSKTSVDLAIGNTLQLTATVSPSNATDKSVTWASSNAAAATVSPTGLVTAIAEGSANITATAGGKSATCVVKVVKPTVAVTSVELDETDITIKKGESKTLTATVKPDNATDKNVSWASSKTDVATVDGNGKVTAVSKGAATITASCSGKTANCKVTVVVPVESISLNKPSITLTEGDSETLVATVKPSDASNQTVEWKSSNTQFATVDNNGKVTAVKEGTATITASCEEKTATCEVTVAKKIIAVTSITLDHSTLDLEKGASANLTATVKPDDATDKTVTWKSNNTSVATVTDNGLVVAVGGGNTTVVATAGEKTAVCTVNVTVPVTSVTLSNSSLILIEKETKTLTATVKPDDATDKIVVWTSSNPSAATVSNGTVTAVSEGTTTIEASCGGKSAKCDVTVNKRIYVTGVEISNFYNHVAIGDSFQAIVKILPDNATDKTYYWDSEDQNIATVNDGLVVAKSLGKADIRVHCKGAENPDYTYVNALYVWDIKAINFYSVPNTVFTNIINNQHVKTTVNVPITLYYNIDASKPQLVGDHDKYKIRHQWSFSNDIIASIESEDIEYSYNIGKIIIKPLSNGSAVLTFSCGGKSQSIIIDVDNNPSGNIPDRDEDNF